MLECVILIGLPASGKSTFFREHFAATHDHVSKDLLRGVRQPERRQQRLLTESLSAGRPVVVDNTNPTVASRAPLIAIARQHGARVKGYYFETEAADALRRNRLREGRARVPDVAIFTIRKRLEIPSLAEGFDELWNVRLDEAKKVFDLARCPSSSIS
jgi:predicted kinase